MNYELRITKPARFAKGNGTAKLILFFCLIFPAIIGCNKKILLQNGDLVFAAIEMQVETNNFSNAINSVTQTGNETNYTHIGIVGIDDNVIWVIHASPRKGVFRDSLETFLKEEKHIFVYRLKPGYRHFITQALNKSLDYYGQTYDNSFLLNDSSQYCSGLIYHLFESTGIFHLNPMTFKDISGDFHPFWVEHYKKLNIEIPEGVPGCNPNEMATSPAIFFVGKLK